VLSVWMVCVEPYVCQQKSDGDKTIVFGTSLWHGPLLLSVLAFWLWNCTVDFTAYKGYKSPGPDSRT